MSLIGDLSGATYVNLFNQSTGSFDSATVGTLTLSGIPDSILKTVAGTITAAVGDVDYQRVLSQGTGISIVGDAVSNTGILSLTGTDGQVLVAGTFGSAQTGAVTLTLPQSIKTSSSPTFGGLTIGTLAGLLKGTAGAVGTAVAGTDYQEPIAAGTTAQYWRGDKTWVTLNQAAVAGLTTGSSPTFAGLTVGTLAGIIKGTAGALSAAVAGTDYQAPIAAGTTAQYWRGDKTWQTLNQAAVAGLTTADSPTFTGLNLSGLTATKIMGTDGSKNLKSVALSGLSFDGTTLSVSGAVTGITGTANQVLANGTSGSSQTGAVTLTLPQSIHTAATPTFGGLTVGTLAGIIKGTAGVLSAAVAGTDYQAPIAAGTTAQYWRGDKTWQTLNQAAVAGLTTADSPTFNSETITNGIIKFGTGNTGSIALTTWLTAINTGNLKNIYIGGYGCGNANITGNDNFLFGYYAGNAITSGSANIIIGNNNMYTLTDGYHNNVVGSNGQTTNVSQHHTCQLGSGGCAGNNCVSIGHYANTRTTGDYNVVVGPWALQYQTTGTYNTIMGYNAAVGTFTAASSYNTYIGANAGYNMQGCGYNSGVGYNALTSVTIGAYNTAIGCDAGRSMTSANGGVFVGYQAGYSETTANKLYIANTSTSTPLIYGDFSTAILTINNNLKISGLTASALVATDANKQLTSTVSGLSPTFTGLNLSGLTASTLIATDGSKNITSSVTGLTPTFTGLNLSGLTASNVVVTDGSKNLASVGWTGTEPNTSVCLLGNMTFGLMTATKWFDSGFINPAVSMVTNTTNFPTTGSFQGIRIVMNSYNSQNGAAYYAVKMQTMGSGNAWETGNYYCSADTNGTYTGATSMNVGYHPKSGTYTLGTRTAYCMSTIIIDIPNYQDGSIASGDYFITPVYYTWSLMNNTPTYNTGSGHGSLIPHNYPIYSLRFFPESGNFALGSRIQIYLIK